MRWQGIYKSERWVDKCQNNWDGSREMLGNHNGIFWILTLLRSIIGFILPLILIYLVYRIIKKKKDRSKNNYQTPLERLKIRLINGEITKEEYEELKQIINDE